MTYDQWLVTKKTKNPEAGGLRVGSSFAFDGTFA
jgi:hypothetical protein